MSIEQLCSYVLFMFAVTRSIVVTYIMHRHGFEFPIHRVILLAFLASYSIIKLLEGDAIAVLFFWMSAVIAVSVTFDALRFFNVHLNEKLALSIILVIMSGGGVLSNIYIFYASLNTWVKVFSLTVLIAVHIPFLVALTAYFRGRRKPSKKLIESFYVGKDS